MKDKVNEIEKKIVKLLKPTGTTEVSFVSEENAKLREIYKNHDQNKHDYPYENDMTFAIYTYKGEAYLTIDCTIDCNLRYFSDEMKQTILEILEKRK